MFRTLNVVMETGSVALGAITASNSAKIGSGSVVIKPVLPGAMVVGIPGRIVEDCHKPLTDLEYGKFPDPVAEAVKLILKKQEKLGGRLKRLENSSGIVTSENEFRDKRKGIVREFSQGGEYEI